MGDSSKMMRMLEELELLGLVKIEGERVSLDVERNISFISFSIISTLLFFDVTGRDVSKYTSEELVDMCILYGLLGEIVLKRIDMGMKVDEAVIVDSNYLIDLLYLYKSIIALIPTLRSFIDDVRLRLKVRMELKG